MGKKSRKKKQQQKSPKSSPATQNLNQNSKKDSSSSPKSKPSHPVAGYISIGLIVVAIGISIYLLTKSLGGGSIDGCGPGSSCEDVLTSKYAYIGPLPISLFAIPIYGLLGISLISRFQGKKNLIWLGNGATIFILGSALYFTGLQFFVIKSLCKFCLTTHILASIAGILSWQKLKSAPFLGSASNFYTASAFVWVFGIVMQWVLPGPDQNTQISQNENPLVVTTNTPPVIENQVTNVVESIPQDRRSRITTTYGLDVENLPLIGKESAKRIEIVLVDYTCKYCRSLHKSLVDITKQLPDQYAFILLPMPLDSECNKALARRGFKTQKSHLDACEYARLALALYKTDPAAFLYWDNEVMSQVPFPRFSAALEKALLKVDADVMKRHLTSAWVQKQLDISSTIYESHYSTFGKGSMPQLILNGKPHFTPFQGAQDVLNKLTAAYTQ